MKRKTDEVEIRVDLSRENEIETGDKIFDHMLDTLFFYMERSVKVTANWDLKHHLWEDTGLAVGGLLKKELKNKNISRFGEAVIPMDDALVLTALDISRPYLNFPDLQEGEGFQPHLAKEFLWGLSRRLEATVHMVKLNGENTHHVIEAGFKGLGVGLKEALKAEDETKSTKGKLS